MSNYFDNYRYTDPVAAALTEAFGTEFVLENTGGGCVCLTANLEGGVYVLVGSQVDGPLLREFERDDFKYGGGYGVGVYAAETCYSKAYAEGEAAQTGEDVVALAKKAVELAAAQADESTFTIWFQDANGTVEVSEGKA